MAVVRNITKEALSLFRADSEPVRAGKEVEIPDADFVDRAWPKSTWALVKKPAKGSLDASVDDAIVFLSAPADVEPPATDAEEK